MNLTWVNPAKANLATRPNKFVVNSVNLSNANQGTNLQLNNKYYTTAGLTSLNPLTSPEHKKGNKIYILYKEKLFYNKERLRRKNLYLQI